MLNVEIEIDVGIEERGNECSEQNDVIRREGLCSNVSERFLEKY